MIRGLVWEVLKSCVQEITDLPLIVIGTHGHLDHLGGAGEFDQVYLNPLDFTLACGINARSRYDYAKANYEIINPQKKWTFEMSDFQRVKTSGYVPLNGREIFDLGGITLRLLPMPGHTQGSEDYTAGGSADSYFWRCLQPRSIPFWR